MKRRDRFKQLLTRNNPFKGSLNDPKYAPRVVESKKKRLDREQKHKKNNEE